MKEKQSVRQRPLMYISQPGFQPGPVNMQQTFSVKNQTVVEKAHEEEIKEVVPEEDVISSEPIGLEKDAVVQNERENPLEIHEAPQADVPRRKFTELNIQEKLAFFNNIPANVPRSTCLIETSTEGFRGKIIKITENVVTISTQKSPYKVVVNVEDIKDIHIISL